MKKNLFAPLLVCAVLLVLTACGGKDAPDSQWTGGTVYVPEKVECGVRLDSLRGVCTAGDSIYMLGRSEGTERLFRMPLTGGEAQPLEDYLPAGAAPAGYFSAAALRSAPDGTLWQTDRTGGERARWVLRQLDADGKELFRFEQEEEKLEHLVGGGICELAADGDGDVVALGGTGAAVMSREGEARFVLPINTGGFVPYLVRMGDGGIGAAYFYSDETSPCIRLQVIDKASESWGRTFQLPSWGGKVYDGGENALFYYLAGENLRAWSGDASGGGADETILNCVDVGIDSNLLQMVRFMDGGRLLTLTTDRYCAPRSEIKPEQTELLCLSASDTPRERTPLTYATLGLNSGDRMAILDFNRSNPEYQIIVKDYMDYSVDGSRDAAIFRLITEVGAGKIPDILAIESMPVTQWGTAGLLEDLWPWIDQDPEVSRTDLMERVLQAMEIDGKLYEAASCFTFRTMVGAKELVGDTLAWTPEDMLAVQNRLPEGGIAVHEGGTDFLLNILRLDWGQFVDWKNGKCSFDSGGFKEILEFCGNFPQRVWVNQWDNLHEGRQAVSPVFPSDFYAVQMAEAVLNGEAAYVGYPNTRGKAGSCFDAVRTVSMTSACRHKEGAWAFLRTFFLPQDAAGQRNGFPVNKADFQKMAREEMASAPAETEIWGSIAVRYRKVEQEEYDRLMELYDAVDTFYRRDPNLEAIITEAAGAYFAGDKSLDETARLIQNRAQLYVDEQR